MKRFKKVYIEITNKCNLSCNFCPKTKRKLKDMTEEEFKQVLWSIQPYTDYIYFHLMGEPLAHPKLEKFLALSHEMGFKVNITTNGTLIQQTKKILLQAPALRQINVSLHSFEANETKIYFKSYIQQITDFIQEAQQKSQIICSLRLWNMDSETIQGSNLLNEEIVEELQGAMGLDYDLKEKLKTTMSLKLSERVYLNKAEKFEWPNKEREIISERAFCYGLRDQIGILVDGTVVPCCLDSEGNIPLGNLFETPLENILDSTRAKDLYEGFSKRCAVEALCKRCGYVKRYNTIERDR